MLVASIAAEHLDLPRTLSKASFTIAQSRVLDQPDTLVKVSVRVVVDNAVSGNRAQGHSRAAAAAASFSSCFSLYLLRLIAFDCFCAFLSARFAFCKLPQRLHTSLRLVSPQQSLP